MIPQTLERYTDPDTTADLMVDAQCALRDAPLHGRELLSYGFARVTELENRTLTIPQTIEVARLRSRFLELLAS